MTTLIGGYTVFEEQFLVASYYTTNILARDEISFSDVSKTYQIDHLDKNDRWLVRAITHFADVGWILGPLTLGYVRDEVIELTASGLREAERLIQADKFFLERVDDKLVYSLAVPASDRLVSLDHNQISATDRRINEVIEALEADNGDPDQPGLRERLLGEIKAGRELIRAGQFRALLLYETLVQALNEVIKKYKNPIIVALANALLGAVVSQFIQAS